MTNYNSFYFHILVLILLICGVGLYGSRGVEGIGHLAIPQKVFLFFTA